MRKAENTGVFRRFMRAPPLPAGSFVQAVQVDHSTRSLAVDGRPFNGIGWYERTQRRHVYCTVHVQTDAATAVYTIAITLCSALSLSCCFAALSLSLSLSLSCPCHVPVASRPTVSYA
jgi:hypothetical protein